MCSEDGCLAVVAPVSLRGEHTMIGSLGPQGQGVGTSAVEIATWEEQKTSKT
jgi:hypothetical protein